jgi:hypothetical protein
MKKDGGKAGNPLNCWEYMSCGREPGGSRAVQFGVCSAATDERLDLVHGGINGGRTCWAIAGSSGRKKAGGLFAKGCRDCKECDFYLLVKSEEDRYFWPEGLLLKILRQ